MCNITNTSNIKPHTIVLVELNNGLDGRAGSRVAYDD